MSNAALLLALADGPPVEFRSVAVTAAGAGPVTKPSDLLEGDIVVVWALGVAGSTSLTTAGGSVWTGVHDSVNGQSVIADRMIVHAKVLTALDVANAWNLAGAVNEGALAVCYRGHGANAVAVKSTQAGGGGVNISLILAGFTKSAGHYGTIALAITNDTTAAASFPAGFTKRSDTVFNSNAKVALADRQYGYVDGASVTVSNLNPATPVNHQAYCILLEITGP